MTKATLPKIEIVFMGAMLLLLSGCFDEFTRELVASQTLTAGDFTVEETIYRQEGFPDHTFERFYSATNLSGGDSVSLGDFEDESKDGITVDPAVIDGHLVVFSSAHVFIWQPGEEPVRFNPFAAEGWYDFSQIDSINGHYDFNAADVWSSSDQWLIRYDCDYCRDGVAEQLLFYSVDDGRTFDICLAPSVDFRFCLDR